MATLTRIEAAGEDAVVVIKLGSCKSTRADSPSWSTAGREGFDVVYAQRRTRGRARHLPKRIVASLGYRLIKRIAKKVEIQAQYGRFPPDDPARGRPRRRSSTRSHGLLSGLVGLVGFPPDERSLRPRRAGPTGVEQVQPILGVVGDRPVRRYSRLLALPVAWVRFRAACLLSVFKAFLLAAV